MHLYTQDTKFRYELPALDSYFQLDDITSFSTIKANSILLISVAELIESSQQTYEDALSLIEKISSKVINLYLLDDLTCILDQNDHANYNFSQLQALSLLYTLNSNSFKNVNIFRTQDQKQRLQLDTIEASASSTSEILLPKIAEVKLQRNRLECKVSPTINLNGASYAFYLYKGKNLIEKTKYSNSSVRQFTLPICKKVSNYRCRIFITFQEKVIAFPSSQVLAPIKSMKKTLEQIDSTITGCRENGTKVQMEYRLIPANSKRLLVVLHGQTKEPAPTNFRHPEFNVLAPIDHFGVDQCGSWWLGENNDFFVKRMLDELIHQVTKELGIEEIYFWGSSMGGYGAIYHGVNHEAKGIYANIPQVVLHGSDYADVQGADKYFKGIFDADSEYNDVTNCFHNGIKSAFFITQTAYTYKNYVNQQYSYLVGKLCNLPEAKVWGELLPLSGHSLTRRMTDSVNKLLKFTNSKDSKELL